MIPFGVGRHLNQLPACVIDELVLLYNILLPMFGEVSPLRSFSYQSSSSPFWRVNRKLFYMIFASINLCAATRPSGQLTGHGVE